MREGGKGESGEGGLCLCGMAEHTSKHLQDDMLKSHAGSTLQTFSNCMGTSGICIHWRSMFSLADSTSQEASSDPQWPATPLSRGMGSLEETGVCCLCWRREAAANRARLRGELLVLPGLVTMPSVRTMAPQEACCLALGLVQPMEGCQSLSPTSKHEATIGLSIMIVY